jgi:16S rRNA (guanine966-N2)-methyltransferase
MRIISGSLRGKILNSPNNQDTRPTSDKARQGVFNIIEHSPHCTNIVGKIFIDVFAGTGAFGLEALSRGAKKAIFIENNKDALAILRENIKSCRMNEMCEIIAKNACGFETKLVAADYIFLDPPYHKDLINQAISKLQKSGAINENTIIIAEHHKSEKIELAQEFEILKAVNYGINAFIIAKLKAE